MSTFTQIYYQLVFSTKNRKPIMKNPNKMELYKYLYGVLKDRKCYCYIINGVEDHIHFVFSLHPSIALSDLVKSLKHAGTYIIKEKKLFEDFNGWQRGYGAFTYNIKEQERLIRYVINQEKHHNKEPFINEYKRLLMENGVEFDVQYLL